MRTSLLVGALLAALLAGCGGGSGSDPARTTRMIPDTPPTGTEVVGEGQGRNPFRLEVDVPMDGLVVLAECSGTFVEVRSRTGGSSVVNSAACSDGLARVVDDVARSGRTTVQVTSFGDEVRQAGDEGDVGEDDADSSNRFEVLDDPDSRVVVYAVTP